MLTNEDKWVFWLISTGFPFETDYAGKDIWPPCTPEKVAEVLARVDPLSEEGGAWELAAPEWLVAIEHDLGPEKIAAWRRSLEEAR
jgi:hypothetical protein